MNEMKHTPEPWIEAGPSHGAASPVEIDSIVPANYDEDDFVPEICHFDSIAGHEQNAANARRIVLCVNACAGIPDEVLAAPGYSIKDELDSLDTQIAGRMKAEQERDALRARLAALEELATAVEADIDYGWPLEYNVGYLRDELIRVRAALGLLPEQNAVRPKEGCDVQHPGKPEEQAPAVPCRCNMAPVLEDHPGPIAFSCGFCGAPLNANKELMDVPDVYNPDDYPHDACGRCQAERDEPRYVTREMALDAGDPSLEGTEY